MQDKITSNGIFAAQLSARMKELRLTQAQLAGLVRMSQPGIGRYLQGNIPNADNLYALAKALGMSMEELLTGKKPAQQQVSHRIMEEIISSDREKLIRQTEKVASEINILQNLLKGRRGTTGKVKVDYKK